MSEPRVPSDTSPAEADAPVVRDEETGEQRYPEQYGGTDEAPTAVEEAEDEGRR